MGFQRVLLRATHTEGWGEFSSSHILLPDLNLDCFFVFSYPSLATCYLAFKNLDNVPLKLKWAAETAVPTCENVSLIAKKFSISKCRNTNTDSPPENVYMGERIDVGNTHSFHHAVFKINTKYHQHSKCACGANKEKFSSYQSKTLHYTHIFPQGDD